MLMDSSFSSFQTARLAHIIILSYTMEDKLMPLAGVYPLLSRYPSDVDKHILARQTGLSRSQVRTLASSISILVCHRSADRSSTIQQSPYRLMLTSSYPTTNKMPLGSSGTPHNHFALFASLSIPAFAMLSVF